MITRYDSSTVSAITKDPITGYIHARNVPIARAGVFKYLKPDGTVRHEAKLPEDILSDSTVASANNKPITDNHPENEAGQRILVDKSNTNTLMKGLTASNAHVDEADGTVRVDLTITNPDLINKVDNGKRQLSIGFQTQVVPQSGVYKNTEYDSVQKDITINHVAVVDVAREGPDISLDRSVVGDSAEMIGELDDFSKEKGQKPQMDFEKVRIGDQTIKVATDDADKLIKFDSDNSANQKRIDELNAQIKKLTDERDALKSGSEQADKDKSEAQAKADSLEKELQDYRNKFEGDGFQKAVDERMALIDNVKSVVGDSFDPHGKTDKEMKIEAIKHVDGDASDVDGQNDTYIDAYFKSIMNRKKSHFVGATVHDFKGDSADSNVSVNQMHENFYNLANKNKGGNK
ncbi:DUF2213 domain-containing protein [Lactobacillus crispatus]|uniref:DUF2213 domain-containing protein n=1 Tax=Lactobacillus crispatus TaxID=47770 RepID=UPI00254E60FB|nr:DUF2213 domain-containing protein [Lactobacillus crispatus]MDK7064741.1 DUF2213 domain-containing protein [Lactobacillus crispatus]MDK7367880.1 DUF2213 domain-containing protein [Lactobacillus crispatus]